MQEQRATQRPERRGRHQGGWVRNLSIGEEYAYEIGEYSRVCKCLSRGTLRDS